jgi:hypothetical protein
MNPWSSELRMLGAISAFVIPARLLQLAIAMKEKACEEATRTARFSHQNYGSLVERRSGPVSMGQVINKAAKVCIGIHLHTLAGD